MKDLIPLGTGNSRFMKSGISPNTTYQQLLAMLINGTFPFDFNGINPEGISQMGSAYSVANVLPEDVCSALGIPTTSEPKDAFAQLQANIGAITNIIVASRVGTGASNDFTIIFPEKPKYVFFFGAQDDNSSFTTIAFIAGMDMVGANTAFDLYFLSYDGESRSYESLKWRMSGTNTALDISRPSGKGGNYLNSAGDTYYYIYIV